MYSGITGQEFPADIYIGLVYYQRLRHMVGDKWQVRTIGPVDQITRQPVKGRKKGGGIRFGEMERDALLAHGTSYLLQDRLMNCSDYSTAWVCRTCGSLISLGYEDVALGTDIGFGQPMKTSQSEANGEYCRVCRSGEDDRLSQRQKKDLVTFGLSGQQPEVLGSDRGLDVIAIPYVFRYLVAELAACGIDLKIGLSK
jgi:DNA-directed RNA polymerase I subunit RPA2